jgi:conjugal transfer/entry exclusion protein
MTNNENKNYKNYKNVGTKITDKAARDYSYYSRVLNKPFDSIEELKEAEAAHYAELKAKEAKAAAKKADAQKVEDAFKALNFARKAYKNNLIAITENYSEKLKELKAEFDKAKTMEHNMLADAEANYQAALREFTTAHPEGYHVTLKDGDFETTISGCSKTQDIKKVDAKDPSQINLLNLFDLFFGL